MSICKPCTDAADSGSPELHEDCLDCPCQHKTDIVWEKAYIVPRKDS